MSNLTEERWVAADLRAPLTPAGRTVVDLLAGVIPRISAEAADRDRTGTFPVEAFEQFAKLGLMGATVPAELGGLGLTRLYDVATALMRLAEADASTALAWHVQLSRGLTLTYEWQHGTPPVRAMAERLLRAMAEGEAAVCGALKDAPGVVTELHSDGAGGWLLSGRKVLVSMAPIATHFFVHAQRRDDDGSVFLAVPVVHRDAPGLTVLDNWDGLGMRASGTLEVVFDRCPVRADELLERGPVGARRDAVLAGQTVSSITMLGIYAGIAQAARDIAVGFCAGRGGEPRAGARALVAGLDTRLYALRTTVGAALTNADAASVDLSGDPDERGRRMMTPFQYAKMTVNELAPAVVDDCLSLVGGLAYTAGHPLSRLYRDVRAGGFMQPYSYVDAVDYLSGQALGLDRDNDYMSVRALRSRTSA
ncbi:nitrososynthase [Micromonospora sp. ATCC 39149]|uniref:L-evernosamine nitrososynthase n=2 Tax=Micromonospora TaxID=1873 RepID=NITSS_MICS3|nr:acyl-CoA dehydrogenase family protein [Micromonospora sp. ATCC 39149]C4RPA1.1 RecName: Full=L-evernosamine nitrososynthase; AltName: Full=FAD-dependent nitrososynthase; AltName: Full=ORF36 [Micromonospora sp. ATCC 39149]EEP73337.1 nitrososynthase [Micromonospora sp. ATCC 39149]QLJ99345.1 acyl-CoA/acyl-ACP dehydrogenase [Micromonospora carbonacea]